MLRLIIVDDERIIRETISTIIDWESLGIKVIGTCKNGIEAYDMILDEYPDIVLTDIKMPGLSGIDLIEKVRQIDENINFVILSGYGEFSFAKKAMQYGVKHYLLKPCSEEQIIEVMKQVIKECSHNQSLQEMEKNHQLLISSLHNNIIRNIIVEGLNPNDDLPSILKRYEHYIDFNNMDYYLHYLYYLEDKNLNFCIDYISSFFTSNYPGIIPHFIYVKNTLVMFFKCPSHLYHHISDFFENINVPNQSVSVEHKKSHFSSLYLLLVTLLSKLNRYEFIYLMNNGHAIPIYNHSSLFISVDNILNKFLSDNTLDHISIVAELEKTLSSIEDGNFLKGVITTFLVKFMNSDLAPSNPTNVTDLLLEINDIDEPKIILGNFLDIFKNLLTQEPDIQSDYKDFIEKTLTYVQDHLSDPNLSLKWIAENHLFMNVDYLSKQFVKQTGYRFSQYLTEKRIEKAKELLQKGHSDKIYIVAEQVGCGNNPQYFSQIFKKHTGMTPTEYVKSL